MSAPEVNAESSKHAGASSANDLDDLEQLNFPPDVDWSSTLILRCDPDGVPYKMADIYNALYNVVRRNDVFNLGPTKLNYAFTLSFKTDYSTENFVRYLTNKRREELTIKNRPCSITRIPSKCATINVRWIPMEIDSVHIVNVLKQYGTIVKTELIQSNMRGWFHVYTNERKFTLFLNQDIDVSDLPYAIYVKGLLGAVLVQERNPKCLDCYYSGHSGDTCKYKGCPLYRD